MYVRLMIAALGALFGAWLATAAMTEVSYYRLNTGADGLAEMMEPQR